MIWAYLMIAATSQRREPHRRPRRSGHRARARWCSPPTCSSASGSSTRAASPTVTGQQRRAEVLRGARPAATSPSSPRPRHGRVLRLPVVERRAREDLHGGHRVAGPRRGARRPRDHVSRTEMLLLVARRPVRRSITLSVIIQVGSFKLTGKRVFRMAPLQHHFELLGWQRGHHRHPVLDHRRAVRGARPWASSTPSGWSGVGDRAWSDDAVCVARPRRLRASRPPTRWRQRGIAGRRGRPAARTTTSARAGRAAPGGVAQTSGWAPGPTAAAGRHRPRRDLARAGARGQPLLSAAATHRGAGLGRGRARLAAAADVEAVRAVARRHRHQRQDHDRAACSSRCWLPRGTGPPPSERRAAAVEAVLRPRAVRRPRGRAVQLPAALDRVGAARWPARASTSRRTTSTGTARRLPPLRGGQGTGLRAHAGGLRLQRGRPGDRAAGRATPTSRRALGPSASPSGCRPSVSWAWWRTCWSTARSSPGRQSGGGGARHAGRAARRRRPPWRRTTSPTRSPPPRWPAAYGVPPAAVRGRSARLPPGPHRIAQVADRRRRGLRRRLQGHQPARRRRVARRLRAAWCGSPAAWPRARPSTTSSARRRAGCAAWCSSAGPGCPGREALARHAPDVPVVEVDEHGHWGRWTRSCEHARARSRAPGDTVLLAPRGRVDGHVPRLRAARGGVRGGGARLGLRTAGRADVSTAELRCGRHRAGRACAGHLPVLQRARLSGRHLLPAARRARCCCWSSAWSWCSRRRR